MKKIKYYLINTIAVIALVSTSCNKDKAETIKEVVDDNKEILVFDSFELFEETSKAIISMSLPELVDYEEGNGYISFGRKCDEIYSNINFDSFQTQEELTAFVKANSEYLEIAEGEDGEMYLEPALSKNPYRYFVNDDLLFSIGGTTYKVFDEGLVSTDDNIEALKKIDRSGILAAKEDPRFSFMPIRSEVQTKAAGCGTHFEARSTVDRDRVLLEISIDQILYNGVITHKGRILIRPYKKTLGIWYWCSRTISYDINMTINYRGLNDHGRMTGTKYDSKVEFEMFSGVGPAGSYVVAMDCWATTPSVNYKRATLTCNTHLLPK